MIKIAINFKQRKDEIIEELKEGNYDISTSSFNTIWVNDLSHIDYKNESGYDGIKIKLVKNKIDYRNEVEIYLEDIEYFEIH